jgi:hypothetical protein
MQVEMWTYREADAVEDVDLTGFEVEATDGPVGKIEDAAYELGSSWLVVDTGPWIFGKKVLLPAAVVETVDIDEGKIFVNRTKDEIKNAPEFDKETYRNEAYRGEIAGYYASPTRDRTRL